MLRAACLAMVGLGYLSAGCEQRTVLMRSGSKADRSQTPQTALDPTNQPANSVPDVDMLQQQTPFQRKTNPATEPGLQLGVDPKLASLYTYSRRLNTREIDQTLADIFGDLDIKAAEEMPREQVTRGFDTDGEKLYTNREFVGRYTDFVMLVAEEIAPKLLAECQQQNATGPACFERIINAKLPMVFRQVTSPAEVQQWQTWISAVKTQRQASDAAALESLVAAWLLHEKYLFIGSKGLADGKHDRCVQKAEHLAIVLWSSAPDAQLLQKTVGETCPLSDPGVLTAEVDRMMADSKFQRFLNVFANSWWPLEAFKFVQVTPEEVGMTTEAQVRQLQDDMIQETTLTIKDNFDSKAPIVDLLIGRKTFLNDRLAAFYSITGATFTSNFQPFVMPSNHPRQGLLTHGAILANFPGVIRRGLGVASRVTCTDVPEPPEDANMFAANEMKFTSERQIVEVHSQAPGCASCHNIIDPPGYVLLSFDRFGRHRTQDELGATINTQSMWNGKPIAGLSELLAAVAADGRFPICTAEALLTYGLGRGISYNLVDEDHKAIDRLLAGSNLATVSLYDLVRHLLTHGMTVPTNNKEEPI